MTFDNILITGSPCCGKSTIAEIVAKRSGWTLINVGEVAKKENLIESYDTDLDCAVIDDDMVVDYLTPKMKQGRHILEYHGCSLFPENWFRAIYVLRTETTPLYDRLSNRGYSGHKLQENMECEIFQVLLEEARDSFDPSIVHELQNNVEEDIEKNVSEIVNKLSRLLS